MLSGKTVLITGSSRGIGAATARLAKSYGANVILHGRSESEALKALSKELACDYIVCDVADATAVAKACEQLSKVDVLVNCAGIAPRNTFLESDDNLWLDIFKVNVLGTVHFCREIIPKMQKQNYGRIVNISSIRGFQNTCGRPAYSASKAAIVNLTSSLAKEFAPTIAVNSVAPGFTETEMTKVWDEELWKKVNKSLMDRIAQPNEIGEVVCFLASDKASFISGQTIIVDGGYSLAGK